MKGKNTRKCLEGKIDESEQNLKVLSSTCKALERSHENMKEIFLDVVRGPNLSDLEIEVSQNYLFSFSHFNSCLTKHIFVSAFGIVWMVKGRNDNDFPVGLWILTQLFHDEISQEKLGCCAVSILRHCLTICPISRVKNAAKNAASKSFKLSRLVR
jgi:hypothetical protein